MQKIVLVVVGAALVIIVALNTHEFASVEVVLQTNKGEVETVSKAHSMADEMRGLLIREEGFRLLLPLNKTTNHTPFQVGFTHNSYKNILLVRYGALQKNKVLKQQFLLVTLQNLYIPLRI